MRRFTAKLHAQILLPVVMAFIVATPAIADEVSQDIGTTAAASASDFLTSASLLGYYPTLHALCIGINDYADSAIPDLEYAENDARDVAIMLRQRFGFSDARTLLGKDATRDGITRAVATMFDQGRVGTNDGVLIYYSGHGQTIDLPRGGEMGFLVPQDARVDLAHTSNLSLYYTTCIAMDEVHKWRELIPARHVLIIADSCYSGLLATDRSIPRPVGDALALEVCQILTAGTRGQKARELPESGHGAFTAKMLEALRTGAADINKDGYIRASELGQYLKDCLIEGQSPQSKVMNGEGDFILWPREGVQIGVTHGVASQFAAAIDQARDLAQQLNVAKDAYESAIQIDESGVPRVEKAKVWLAYLESYRASAYNISQAEERATYWQQSGGAPAKDFTLPDADGKLHSLADYKGKIVVLEWTQYWCPLANRVHHEGIMQRLAAKYADKGVVWLGINSHKTETAADSKAWAKKYGLSYPTLQDHDGKVGHLYGAKTSNHMFVIDKDGNIAYQGAINNDAAEEKEKKGEQVRNYVDEAVTQLLANQKPETSQTSPWGCSMKYENPN